MNVSNKSPHSCNNLLDTLLVTLHVEECPNLAERQILTVAQSHQLIKGAEEVVGIPENLPLVQALAGTGDDLREQVERVDILQDVRLAVGDEHHVELVERLVDESDIILLDCCMLRAAVG